MFSFKNVYQIFNDITNTKSGFFLKNALEYFCCLIDIRFFTLISIFVLISFNKLFANPEKGEIKIGKVFFEQTEKELKILQISDRAIIDWDKFSIQEGEITEFLQPSSGSSVLNRVAGDNLSEIYGTLKSNGEIVLINPQGILIGSGGLVDVGSFIGSTMDLKNEEFIENKSLNFIDLDKLSLYNLNQQMEKAIVNQGRILAKTKDVILIAQNIDNQGQILAEKGSVNLKAGCEVTLLPQQDNQIKVRLKKQGKIYNSGTIRAIQTELEAAGGMAECLAVSAGGLIEANGVAEKDGKLVLLSDETISCSGTMIAKTKIKTSEKKTQPIAQGGTVHLLGKHVRLEENALIDASGENGGGEVLIGGDFQGKNPQIKNADYTCMAKTAKIHADSLSQGNGGKVILWSDKATLWQGLVTVKGGKKEGNGGLIEVSSKGFLNPQGIIDATAINGKSGELLLDPYNLAISSGANQNVALYPAVPDYPTVIGPTSSPSVLNVLTLASYLDSANVSVQTNTVGGAEAGDLTVDAAISNFSGNDLRLYASGSINLNANIALVGAGDLALYINRSEAGAAVNFASGVTITSQGGSGFPVIYGNGSSGNAIVYNDTTAQTLAPVTAADAGYITEAAGTSIIYASIQSITLNDNSSNELDLTNMTKAQVTMTAANSGSVLDIDTSTNWLDSFANVHTITAPNSGSDIIIAPDGGQTINITGQNDGNITGILDSFVNFANVKGGSGDDTFVFETDGYLSGSAYGQGGTNTLDFSAKPAGFYFSALSPDGGIEVTTYAIGSIWSDFANFIGSNGGGNYFMFTAGSSLSGTITFNGEGNALYWYQFGNPVAVDMNRYAATAIKGGGDNGFSNVKYFFAAEEWGDENASSTVGCPNENVTVNLRGHNVFDIEYSSSSYNPWFYFFPLIVGRNGDDTFSTQYQYSDGGSYFIDNINGGGGYNTLDFRVFPISTTIIVDIKSKIGAIPGVIDFFSNFNVIYLPQGGAFYFDDYLKRTALITDPIMDVVETAQEKQEKQEKSMSLFYSGSPTVGGAARFLIQDQLVPGIEIQLGSKTSNNFIQKKAQSMTLQMLIALNLSCL